MKKIIGITIAALLVAAGLIYVLIKKPGGDLNLTIPEDFKISIFAKDLGDPRVMAWDPAGNLLASVPQEGKIIAVSDKDEDGVAETKITVVSGLKEPHGTAFDCRKTTKPLVEPCKFYVAETNKLSVFDYDAQNIKAINKKSVAELPSGSGHSTRSLLFMPVPNENKLLVSIGSSCNVCHEQDERRAKVMVLNVDRPQDGLKIFARGLRNAVFMNLHPVSGDVWATEMGRDHLGDNLPPDEINIVKEGRNYGWPICYGKNIHDTEFDKNTYIRNPCMELLEAASLIDIPAHSAPLGTAFVPEEGWPQEYWYNALVAYHGSWNRSTPTGYKIVRYMTDFDGRYNGQEDFITGWLDQNGKVTGRPVDIIIQPGGTIYISDDHAGVIYKLVRHSIPASERPIEDLIKVSSPKPGALITSPVTISGEARGFWYFEASFPAKLLDANGKQIAITPIQALGEWMKDSSPSLQNYRLPLRKLTLGLWSWKKITPPVFPSTIAVFEFQ